MSFPNCELSIDLEALSNNWLELNRLSGSAECAAVVKANAYGLGAPRVAQALYRAGCRSFYVTNLTEALELRACLEDDVSLFVLSGVHSGEEQAFLDNVLQPVLISKDMLLRWRAFNGDEARACAIKVNTGMSRLGIEAAELRELVESGVDLQACGVELILSHLACADEPEHEMNRRQLERFRNLREWLSSLYSGLRFSLANSAGTFLGGDYHFDMVRPGIALYGGRAAEGGSHSMQNVVSLMLPVLQVRKLPAGESVGYGATSSFSSDRTLAIVAGGYADGIFRALSNKGEGYIGDVRVPIVGRVSMDATVFDVTALAGQVKEGDQIEVLGKHISIDAFAAHCATIGYEVITSLGGRFPRCYTEGLDFYGN